MRYAVLAQVSLCYSAHIGRLLTRYSPVRHWSYPEGYSPFDLNVLCTPPAFILSQDQTLWSLYIHWGSPQSTSSLRVIQFAQLLFRVSLLFFKRIFEFLALCAKLNFFSFVVVQFSKIRRFPLSRSALLVYHFVLSLSTPFFKFFKTFLCFLVKALWFASVLLPAGSREALSLYLFPLYLSIYFL